ncbi:MAG TPA: PilC/PilY family type IV pilus protein [Labilithrix sp.]|nr:PilC/PilY family type IV pilus protein [Labilithrix sp.]
MRADLNTRTLRKRTLSRAIAVAFLGTGATLLAARDAHAQSASTQKPMPNVLLLVDTSGSMERMTDNSLPSANVGVSAGGLPNACSPGLESNPNRWGMLLQALTGNMQPYFSCAAMNRASGAAGAAFRNEYKIAGVNPYDTDYVLPYHRPLTGTSASSTVCALGPNRLPGAASGTTGVGPDALGYGTPAGQGGDVRDFPDDALQSAKYTYMQSQYGTNNALASPLGTNSCIFDQSLDGQLDAARDYVRFALMTFDNDENAAIGVNGGVWPPQASIQTGSGLPFLGQWSYRRDSSNPFYALGTLTPGAAEGLPTLCAPPQQAFEVGARHYGAPPWEGRMVPFPAEDASLLDIQRTNEQIQKVLIATRPFGATPIDGMMDDARDYYWYNSTGPKSDPYVATANCRDQYIILLTDGAPNLDLRPSCQGPGGNCPFPNTAAQTAAALYADTTRRVTTFVIGFSVNGASTIGGDGFPAPYNTAGNNNCKAWYAGVGGNPTAMAAACATAPPVGSTAEACCQLNRIAYEGSGGASAPSSAPAVGPFFAESQADIVLSFGKILAAITKTVSTRTVPAYTPAVYSSTGFGAGATTAQFLGSFIPNAQKPWSGEILRERSTCGGTPLAAAPVTPSISAGDSMAVNLATQGAANRLFITVVPDKYSGLVSVGTPPSADMVDASRSVRPFYPTTADGIPAYSGTERAEKDWGLRSATDIKLALEIDKTTCKRGRAATTSGSGSVPIPALDQDSGDACTRVVMGFATAHVGAISETGTVPGGGTTTYDFNIRCATGGSASAGRCSLTNATCDVADPSACAAVGGQVCVPTCAPLGAIFRANPVVNGPPDSVIRDAGYRAFQARRRARKPTLYAATTDGILHAFKAVETTANAHHELWSFIPPAVLPRLASNYPSGNQILLDGSPVVKDVVWERAPTDLDNGTGLTPGSKWHTTLVAGLGAGGGGYYSVNVTDSDCNNAASPSTTGECATTSGTTGYQAPTKGSLDEAGAADYDTGTPAKRGPHFLWQLTDVPKNSATDPARVVRRTRDGVDMVSLFGRNTGTPAITTLQVKLSSGDRQVGVAILPGGIDGSPIAGQTCSRVGTASDFANDPAKLPRTSVRRWAQNCTGANSAVPGRGVTIVRLDNGQILRHFGRQIDVPESIWNANVVTPSPFDSPMVGTPVVYPQTVGAVAQKIFVGDADGTIWRIDVSNSDPARWKAMLFADLISGGTAAESQPIQVTPVISLEPGGSLVVNAATGDQENIIFKSGEKNYVWSILEQRPVSTTTAPLALTKWVETLNDGERVTGPMTVFDRTLYFASFAPKVPSPNQCDNAGVASLWGLNYVLKESSGSGGAPMWCDNVSTAGVCTSTTLVKKTSITTGPLAGYVIPGVTLRATQACSKVEDIGEGTGATGFETLTPSEFQLSYGVGKARSPSTGFPPAATLTSSRRPLPRVATTVNAWALVVD